MASHAEQLDARYTWDDYCHWNDGERWEIIEGIAYNMSPAPTTRHQAISRELALEVGIYLRGKPCQPFTAPIDVKLSEHDVVQPDLIVVCNPEQIERTHIEGPPTLIVEILSPSTHRKDRLKKTQLYARVGVQELWIVDPEGLVELFTLRDGKYVLGQVHGPEDTLVSEVFPDLAISLARVFPPPEPKPPVTTKPPPKV